MKRQNTGSHKIVSFLGILLLSFLFFGSATMGVWADELDDIQDEIKQKESEKQKKDSQINDSRTKELEERLKKLPLNEQLAVVQEDIDLQQKDIEKMEKEIGEKELEISQKQNEIDEITDIRNKQMLVVYISSRTRTLSVLFSGKTPVKIMQDLMFLNASVKSFSASLYETQELYENLEKEKNEIELLKKDLDEKKDNLDRIRADLEEKLQEIQAQIDAQNAVQANLHNEILAIDKEISGLSSAAAAIIASKAGSQTGSGGGSPGGGGGSQNPGTGTGSFDVYRNGTLVSSGVVGPVTVSPVSGVRFSVGSKMYRGEIIFRDDTNVNFINKLSVQNYLRGIGEMPSSWKLEALKSQATAARTYAYANWGKRTNYHYNLLDNTNDQNYVGYGKEVGSYGSNWVNAVDQTNKKVIKKNGGLITAWYHSTCGGHTISSQEKWGGSRTWAVGVSDRYSSGGKYVGYDSSSPYYSKKWGSSTVTTSTLTDLVNAALYLQINGASTSNQNRMIASHPTYLNPSALRSTLGNNSIQSKIGTITNAYVVYNDGGSSLGMNSKHTSSVKIVGTGGTISISSVYVKLAYNLRSPGTNYIASSLWYIKKEGSSWNFYSMGWGHRVGLCQYGAQGRAKSGQSYSTIISHYYNGSTTVSQNPPASNISIGITQAGGSSTTFSRDGSFNIYSNGTLVLSGTAGQSWKIVRK